MMDDKLARLKTPCRPGATGPKTVGGGDSPHGVFNPPPPWLAKVSSACLDLKEPCPSRTFQNCKSFSTGPRVDSPTPLHGLHGLHGITTGLPKTVLSLQRETNFAPRAHQPVATSIRFDFQEWYQVVREISVLQPSENRAGNKHSLGRFIVPSAFLPLSFLPSCLLALTSYL